MPRVVHAARYPHGLPSREVRALAEPWFPIAKAAVLPPLRLWFEWHFEGLDAIPPQGPAIVACNHISYLDPLANAYAIVRAGRRPRFLAKDELFRIPLIGSVLRGTGQIPVRRGTQDVSPMRRLTKAVTEDEVVLIYPEGTVTKRPDHLPMPEAKTGAVRLSLATGVPITPMASWGSQAVWQKSGRGSLKFGRPVWVKVGPAIDLSDRTEQADDREALREMTGEVMGALTALTEDLRARYPRRWASPDG